MLAALQPFLIGLLVTAAVTPAVIRLAWRMGWVARPRDDRHHQKPTALMGGVAISAGAALAWFLGGLSSDTVPIIVAAALLFLFGLVDDLHFEFKPRHKLVGQVVVAVGLVAAGVTFQGLPPVLGVPLALVWIVGITNAVNLLDNMDGLAAGISTISALSLAAYCSAVGDIETAVMALGLAGACAGFLIYNFNPARIFMGDCGSMFIGCALAALALRAGQASGGNPVFSLLVPLAALAVPIFDTSLVAVCRKLNGRPVLPGARDHSSHRLAALGLSDRATALLLYALALPFAALVVGARYLPLPVTVFLVLLLVGALAALGSYLGFLKIYEEGETAVPAWVRHLGDRMGEWRHALQMLMDALVIGGAFIGACLVRYDGTLPALENHAQVLLIVVGVKVAALAFCRAYRGVWRHAGMLDALTVVGGATLALVLLLAIAGTTSAFQGLSRSVLLIDWMLGVLLLVGVRTSYVALQEVFGLFPPVSGRRVVIVGTGFEARIRALELRDPFSSSRAAVVGMVGDDPEMKGRTVNGVRVLGTVNELPRIMKDSEASECILGVRPESASGQSILAFCRAHEVPVSDDADLWGVGRPASVAHQHLRRRDGLPERRA